MSVTAAQVPAPLTLQAWQTPQLLVVQQTPSTQLPELHSLPELQVPFGPFLAAQLPGELVLPVQYRVVLEQSAFDVHVVLQDDVPQT